jgi:hypothetical protein
MGEPTAAALNVNTDPSGAVALGNGCSVNDGATGRVASTFRIKSLLSAHPAEFVATAL